MATLTNDLACGTMGSLILDRLRMGKRQLGYDIIHVVHGAYPQDPRMRREAGVAADVADRHLVVQPSAT